MPRLVICVRFHQGRYHGRPQGGADWPPSPARLFQALVAGAIRAPKLIRPILFEAETPLVYCWTFDDNPEASCRP